MDATVLDLIGRWKQKGESDSDPFVKFIFFFICLDAWLTNCSRKDRWTDKVRWLLQDDNVLKREWPGLQGEKMRSYLNGLKKVGICR